MTIFAVESSLTSSVVSSPSMELIDALVASDLTAVSSIAGCLVFGSVESSPAVSSLVVDGGLEVLFLTARGLADCGFRTGGLSSVTGSAGCSVDCVSTVTGACDGCATGALVCDGWVTTVALVCDSFCVSTAAADGFCVSTAMGGAFDGLVTAVADSTVLALLASGSFARGVLACGLETGVLATLSLVLCDDGSLTIVALAAESVATDSLLLCLLVAGFLVTGLLVSDALATGPLATGGLVIGCLVTDSPVTSSLVPGLVVTGFLVAGSLVTGVLATCSLVTGVLATCSLVTGVLVTG